MQHSSKNSIFVFFKYLAIAACGLIVILSSMCLYPQLNGYYSSGACFPVTYPDGTRPRPKSTEEHLYFTGDPVRDVVSFFKHQLNTTIESEISENNSEIWVMEQLDDTGNEGYLFRCFTSHGNGYTAESACIYVQQKDKGTQIKTGWYFWNSGIPFPCP